LHKRAPAKVSLQKFSSKARQRNADSTNSTTRSHNVAGEFL
jgi:hypothetical protein